MPIKALAVVSSILYLILFAGCSVLQKTIAQKRSDPVAEIKLTPFWVSDSLAKENPGFRKINRFAPLKYENQIIAANALDGIISYDVETKSQKWRYPIRYGVESAGVVAGGMLFFGALDGAVYALNADNGQLIWRFETKNEIVAEPLLNNGVIYILNAANALFALEASSGKQLWVYNRQETSSKMTVRGSSRPTYHQGILYAGFSDGNLVALNAQTGSAQWEVFLNKNARFKDIDASPFVDGDQIYVNSYDDKLYCLSKSAGTILWRSDFGGATAPIVSGDKLFYSSSKGYLISVAKSDGKLLWKKETSLGVFTEPVLYKGNIVVGESQGSLLFFDLLSGEKLAHFDPGRGIMSRINIVDNVAYFISGEANVYGVSIDKKTMSQIPYLVQ